MSGVWTPQSVRDQVVDYIKYWSERTEIKPLKFVGRLKISPSKYYEWVRRYGQANRHGGKIPKAHWLEEWEKEVIAEFYLAHVTEGYRRCAFMMLDEDVAAVSPSSVYRVLSKAGLLGRWNEKESGKGKGFNQPKFSHGHWHIDVSYVNIKGTFYYLCGILDGYSRFIVHHEIRESMTEKDIEIILQRAREKFPLSSPRIISDNGPQFIAGDFKEFIRMSGMTHVRTSPYYPQSNGKIERWHKSVKSECIRPGTPLSLEEARRIVSDYVNYYNEVRLHSTIGYIAPNDKLEGRADKIADERKKKIEEAKDRRAQSWKLSQSDSLKRVS